MPTDYSGNPVPPKQYYLCPHCKEQSPLTKEWVGLTDEDRLRLWLKTEAEDVDRYAFAKAVETALKEKNT
jgi:RNA polymerase subunit RPABC4/transcription elongation factor Spt4